MNRRAYALGVVAVALAMAAAVALRAYAEAAFLHAYGARWLPYLLVGQAIAFAAGTTLYDVAAARVRLRGVDIGLALGLAGGAAAAPGLVARGGGWPFAVALAVVAISSVLNLAVWNAVAAAVAGRDARRWLPRAGAGAPAGGGPAGRAAAAIIPRAGADVVPWAAAALALALIGVGAAQARALAQGGAPGATAPPGASAALSGDHRSLLRWLAVAALLEAAIATTLDFRFGASLKARYGGADLATAISLFLGGTHAVLLLLQVTVVPRLLVTRNLPFTVSAHPLLIGLGLAGLAAAPGFALLAVVRTADNVLRAATSRTGQEIALSTLPPAPRARWKVLLRGAATPLGAALGGGALVLAGRRALTEPAGVAACALVVALAWLASVRIGSRRFLAALAAPIGMKRVALARAPVETLDLDAIQGLIDAAGAADARIAALARTALARHAGGADELAPRLDHEDPVVRRALYQLAVRRPSPAATSELCAAAMIEDDGPALAAAIDALAAHGARDTIDELRGRAELDPDARRALRAATARLGGGDAEAVRAALGDLAARDGLGAAALARTRGDMIDADAIDAAVASALAQGAARQAFGAAAGAGGPASIEALLAALAGGDDDAYAAIAGIDRAGALHLTGAIATGGPAVADAAGRAALARALAVAPDAGDLLARLAEDEDEDVREAALRGLVGAARCGRPTAAALAARLVERERDGFVALVAARRPPGARPALHDAELARATRRALRRVLDAVALETAAAGRDPAPLAAAARRLGSRAEAVRRRALDVLQEVGKTRPKVLDAVEQWFRPPVAGAAEPGAAANDLAPHDPWLARLLTGELAPLEPRLAALRACPFFDALAGVHAAELAATAAEHTVAAGAALFDAGASGDAMYAVIEGELVVESAAARPRLGAGSIVGELALIDAAPRAVTVRAAAATRLLRIDRDTFTRALDRWPELGAGLLATLAARLR